MLYGIRAGAAGRFGVPWAFLIMERVLRSKRIFGIKTHFFLRLVILDSKSCSGPLLLLMYKSTSTFRY